MEVMDTISSVSSFSSQIDFGGCVREFTALLIKLRRKLLCVISASGGRLGLAFVEEVGNESVALLNIGRYDGIGILISGINRSKHAGFEIGQGRRDAVGLR